MSITVHHSLRFALALQVFFVVFSVLPSLLSVAPLPSNLAFAVAPLLQLAKHVPESAFILIKAAPQALLAAALLLSGTPTLYARLVAAGLLLGAGGDALLEGGSEEGFVAGLALFLFGHLAYAGALAGSSRGRGFRGLTVATTLPPVLAAGSLVAALLRKGLPPPLPLAVPIYAAVIVLMLTLALSQSAGPLHSRRAAAAGALLFTLSDAVLSVDKFLSSHAAAKLAVMLTYYAAQDLFFLSAVSSEAPGVSAPARPRVTRGRRAD